MVPFGSDHEQVAGGISSQRLYSVIHVESIGCSWEGFDGLKAGAFQASDSVAIAAVRGIAERSGSRQSASR